MANTHSYSAAEISAVTGATVKVIYKIMGERLPRTVAVPSVERAGLTSWVAVCCEIDRKMPREVPVAVRRKLYATIIDQQSATRVQHEQGIVTYSIDVKPVVRRVNEALARYRRAMTLIVEDPNVQGGAATFRGTRILVHQIAGLIALGVGETELREDYPRITTAMFKAAPIYARANPKRGRPQVPVWRGNGENPD